MWEIPSVCLQVNNQVHCVCNWRLPWEIQCPSAFHRLFHWDIAHRQERKSQMLFSATRWEERKGRSAISAAVCRERGIQCYVWGDCLPRWHYIFSHCGNSSPADKLTCQTWDVAAHLIFALLKREEGPFKWPIRTITKLDSIFHKNCSFNWMEPVFPLDWLAIASNLQYQTWV